MAISAELLAKIEAALAGATSGPLERDCAGRLFAMVDGEEVQIGEAFAEGDARLWRHAGDNLRDLLAEVSRQAAEIDTLRRDLADVRRFHSECGVIREGWDNMAEFLEQHGLQAQFEAWGRKTGRITDAKAS